MTDEHAEPTPDERLPGAPRDPDPADESPSERQGDTEAQDREERDLPGIVTGGDPPAAG